MKLFAKSVIMLGMDKAQNLIIESIKDEKVQNLVIFLFLIIREVITVMTDDNKDNTTQVIEVLKKYGPDLVTNINSFFREEN